MSWVTRDRAEKDTTAELLDDRPLRRSSRGENRAQGAPPEPRARPPSSRWRSHRGGPPPWTPTDTSDTLAGLEYDVQLGLRLYHASPLGLINEACGPGGRTFVDHEFCVREGTHLLVDGRKYAPGIISLQNIADFATSGVPKRVARIKHFLDRARIDGGCGSVDEDVPVKEDSPRWTWKRASSMPGHQLFASDRSIDCRNVIQGRVGNCGFCAGFASLAAQFPESIRRVFDL